MPTLCWTKPPLSIATYQSINQSINSVSLEEATQALRQLQSVLQLSYNFNDLHRSVVDFFEVAQEKVDQQNYEADLIDRGILAQTPEAINNVAETPPEQQTEPTTLETIGWGVAYTAAGLTAVGITAVALTAAPVLGVGLGAYELGGLVLASSVASGAVLGGVDLGVQLTQEIIGSREAIDYTRLGKQIAVGAEIGAACSVGVLTGSVGASGMATVLGESAAQTTLGKSMIFSAGWVSAHTVATATISGLEGDGVDEFGNRWLETAPYSLGASLLLTGLVSAFIPKNIQPQIKVERGTPRNEPATPIRVKPIGVEVEVVVEEPLVLEVEVEVVESYNPDLSAWNGPTSINPSQATNHPRLYEQNLLRWRWWW